MVAIVNQDGGLVKAPRCRGDAAEYTAFAWIGLPGAAKMWQNSLAVRASVAAERCPEARIYL
jgi:hypothetical protein